MLSVYSTTRLSLTLSLDGYHERRSWGNVWIVSTGSCVVSIAARPSLILGCPSATTLDCSRRRAVKLTC